MKETIEIKHVPTKDIEELKYSLRCKCGNVTMTSEVPISFIIEEFFKDTPCSECVPPREFLKSLCRE